MDVNRQWRAAATCVTNDGRRALNSVRGSPYADQPNVDCADNRAHLAQALIVRFLNAGEIR